MPGELVQGADVEVVTREEQEAALRHFCAALAASVRDWLDLANAVWEVQRTRAWEVDQDYGDALAAGTVNNLRPDGSVDNFLGLCRLKVVAFSHQHLTNLRQAAEVVAAFTATTVVVDPPANERQARTLRSLTTMVDLVDGEWVKVPADEKAEAIRRVWTAAMERADFNPVQAAKLVRKVGQVDADGRVRRLFTLTEARKAQLRAAAKLRAYEAAHKYVDLVLEDGEWDQLEAFIADISLQFKRVQGFDV